MMKYFDKSKLLVHATVVICFRCTLELILKLCLPCMEKHMILWWIWSRTVYREKTYDLVMDMITNYCQYTEKKHILVMDIYYTSPTLFLDLLKVSIYLLSKEKIMVSTLSGFLVWFAQDMFTPGGTSSLWRQEAPLQTQARFPVPSALTCPLV